jgi:outer membrane protein
MKRSLALAALLVSSASLICAQTPAAPLPGAPGAEPAAVPAGPSKIAVIAFQVAVAKTNEFQRNFMDLQKKWAPKQQQLKSAGEDVDNQAKQLEAQASKLSETERANRAKAIDAKRKELERTVEDARNDYQQELQGIVDDIQRKLYDVMLGYVEKNGYTVVLNDATQQNPVLYAIETTDITAPVVDAYNVKSGVPAPPPQPAATTPAPASKAPAAKPGAKN